MGNRWAHRGAGRYSRHRLPRFAKEEVSDAANYYSYAADNTSRVGYRHGTVAGRLPVLLAMIGAVLLGWAVAAVFRRQYGGTIQPWLVVLPMLVSALLLWRYGSGPELLQGMVLCLALLYASAADIRTREVPDCVPVTLAVAGLIGRTPEEIPLMILAAVAVTIPQLAAAVMKPGSYGGADIKIMASGAFLLGLSRGLTAIIAGLLLAVVCTALVRKIRKQTMKASFALVPYLSAGILLAYFI